MHASDQELENLKRLQHIDAEVIRNKKKLDELPQRQTILETRQKLSAIIKKKTQVQKVAIEPVKIEKAVMTNETITVKDLSERIGKPVGEIIKKRPKKRSIG